MSKVHVADLTLIPATMPYDQNNLPDHLHFKFFDRKIAQKLRISSMLQMPKAPRHGS